MKTINTVNESIIAKAAREAGIRENENYDAYIVSCEDDLFELVLETEWNRITVYTDRETGEVLGLMAIARSIDDLLSEEYRPVHTGSLRKAA